MVFAPSGDAFRVNTQTLGDQERADTTVLSNGGFVVVWEDNQIVINGHIKAQLYDPLGHAVGSELLVNTQATGGQFRAAVTNLSGGGFVVTWSEASSIQTGSLVGV